MNFYMEEKIWLSDIDVMINDENTLTKNWNVSFRSIGMHVPIMSTNYFLDSPLANKVDEKLRYYERQMESFIASDIAASRVNSSGLISRFVWTRVLAQCLMAVNSCSCSMLMGMGFTGSSLMTVHTRFIWSLE